MPENKYVWLTDAEGNRSRVEPSAVDYWIPFGWAVSAEPLSTDECFVWLQHEQTGGKQRFACSAAPQWQALGWNPCPPPQPVDPTRDPVLVDVEPAKPVKPSPTKSATSGETGKE